MQTGRCGLDLNREHTPYRHQLRERRVLPMWETSRFSIVFIDDKGSCSNQHVAVDGPWHRYQDKKGHLYALRCPLKLTRDEEARVVEDIPPGSWEEKVEARRQERLLDEQRRKAEEKASRRNGRYDREFR